MKMHKGSNTAHDNVTTDEAEPIVFASQLLANNDSYSFTFNEVVPTSYHCASHPYMKGSVTVVE